MDNTGTLPSRNAKLIAHIVLVWFALTLGVAVASPFVAPKAVQLVCAGTGEAKLVVAVSDNADADLGINLSGLDCPACTFFGALPPPPQGEVGPQAELSFALTPLESARIDGRIGGPWQARAPPVFL